ncbi:sulfurtransferase [Pseudomarimonas salicorniae]|uniref:Sulfurtransferase n=1 Tax=Pseudomarimonas salicorniae TaxID=2933270 RepID=A0ABT0GK70_9GAMM|nr:sulfurtransferase [Lysobacter sp. CAU 1642]MCK7594950.1 sulfurtransferase [Lysobacter sp. CAU 1642]
MILNVAAYAFCPLSDLPAARERLQSACEAARLKGTVLLAEEGINLFLAGDESPLRALIEGLPSLVPGVEGLNIKFSWSRAVPFARLKVKIKREIIAFRQPGIEPRAGRAPSADPATVQRWLRAGRDDAGRRLVLIDTRNREEVGHGSFRGAITLAIDDFVDYPAAVEAHRADCEGATVVTFCTGGIRCEKASLWMQQAGWEQVYQLEGGILGYFEAVGGEGWDGRCFVFDQRVSLDPALSPGFDAAPD